MSENEAAVAGGMILGGLVLIPLSIGILAGVGWGLLVLGAEALIMGFRSVYGGGK